MRYITNVVPSMSNKIGNIVFDEEKIIIIISMDNIGYSWIKGVDSDTIFWVEFEISSNIIYHYHII